MLDAPQLVAVAGDWHGNLGFALRQIGRACDAGAGVIVQCGDFGYWRGDPRTRKYLFRLERELAESRLRLFWVDGNHEDHDRLAKQAIDPRTGLRPISDHIAHLPRGHRWTWGGHVWLALGGAVSMDQQWRTAGVDWWPGESLTPLDVRAAIAGGPVDVMVCHDAPAGPVIPDSREVEPPAGLVEQARLHREAIRSVVDATRPAAVFHGHWHVRHTALIDLPPAGRLPDGLSDPVDVERQLRDICVVNGLAHDLADPSENLVFADASGAVVEMAD